MKCNDSLQFTKKIPQQLSGLAACDFHLKHPLSNRKMLVKKGDLFVVTQLEDIVARVRFLDGEAASNRTYVLDRFYLTLKPHQTV